MSETMSETNAQANAATIPENQVATKPEQPITVSDQSVKVFAMVVGEHSGDTLGASLMLSIKKRFPQATFTGIGGPKMIALGFKTLYAMEELSVMGLFEVLARLRRLLQVRRELTQTLSQLAPDVFIGIDAPDFNLTLELKLKAKGIKTVHYVSPSVWAWREKRIFKIAKATNMVLSLLPFEKAFYDKHQVPCTFVGHSLADDIPMYSDKGAARARLSLPKGQKILALMPGSRGGELSRLSEPFLRAALELQDQDPDLAFIAPMISQQRAQQFAALKTQVAPALKVTVFIKQTQDAMTASDCLLTASGTVTLEAALIKRPMVIAYKFTPLTFFIAKRMVKLKWFSLPNLLLNKSLVPELLQDEVTVDNIVELVKQRLYQDQSQLNQAFIDIHLMLKQNASEKAADAVFQLLAQ